MARAPQLIGWAAIATVGALAVSSQRPRARSRRDVADSTTAYPAPHDRARPARLVDAAAALLSALALADSGLEHYRGSFHNKTMVAPLGASALLLASCLCSTMRDRSDMRPRGRVSSVIAIITGIVGTGFHVYNVEKRPGGFSWINLFYAAPLGAPATLTLAGLLHEFAARIRAGRRSIGTIPVGRALAALLSVGLVGSSLEAALLHYRGAFQNRVMFLPVTIPPVAAGMLGVGALFSGELFSRQWHGATRWMLRLVAALGVIGTGFHIRGVQRGMGGWRNWSQNLLNGPPLAAPPSFTALAVVGLAALELMKEEAE